VTSASYINYEGPLNPDNWLVTPQLQLQGTMRVWMKSQDGQYPDNFAIYLSTTGNSVPDFTTTLIGETVAQGDYVEYSADLSSYNGQLGYIAIRHFNSWNQFRLNADDFGLYDIHQAGEWQTVTVTDNTFDINGLTASTLYEWQVQGVNCDGNGSSTEWSESAFFTTALPVVNILADQWYAIAAPTHDDGETTLDVAIVIGLLDADYDLFRYNEADGTWENQKATDGSAEGFSAFDPGRGYIYRRSTDATLIFNGTSNSDNYSYTLTGSCPDNNLKGFNLIGNPYPHAVYKGVAFPADNLTTDYYSLEPNGTWLAHQDSDPIGIGQGVLVQMSGDGQAVLTFTEGSSAPTGGAKGTGNKGLQFSLTGLGYTDVAYALFARGEGLRKVSHLNTMAPSLSIPPGKHRLCHRRPRRQYRSLPAEAPRHPRRIHHFFQRYPLYSLLPPDRPSRRPRHRPPAPARLHLHLQRQRWRPPPRQAQTCQRRRHLCLSERQQHRRQRRGRAAGL
jgi:hypothetical protein